MFDKINKFEETKNIKEIFMASSLWFKNNYFENIFKFLLNLELLSKRSNILL